MNRYDDDHVIALLREAVPPTPDVADRVSAVKQRAGHQRAMVWTQSIGALAAVLLVVGVAAAVATPGAGQRVQPTARPIEAFAAALAKETSVRFEGRVKALGTPDIPESRMSPEQLRDVLDSHVVGAVTRRGDLQIDGDLSFLTAVFDAGTTDDDGEPQATFEGFSFRVVDGDTYRTPEFDEKLPAGKKWIRGAASEADDMLPAELDRALKMLNAIAEDVRHVGSDTVRDTPVAEYELTVPARYTRSKDLRVRFALDDQDRLRQVTAELSLTAMVLGPMYGVDSGSDSSVSSGWTEYPGGTMPGPGGMPAQPVPPPPTAATGPGPDMDPLMVRIEIELFGYGDRIKVEAPPASEVITEDELWGNHESALSECVENAQTPEAMRECYGENGVNVLEGGECTTAPDGSSRCGVTATAQPLPGNSPPPVTRLSPGTDRPRPAATTSPSPSP